MVIPDEQRQFAGDVVRRLRAAGFTAYWAGGCVRDQLLGRTPKDFDVATNATPEQIRSLFGRRRTLALGAAFGVISVIGPKPAGLVEVATFRRDAAYSDGRHPDSVTFSSAEEDASRRDFTINGLFYDPVDSRVIDFVGGQQDLAERRVRAIGNARDRFAEDKLRMLRAVRFAAAFDFTLDADARTAIAEMAAQIHVVSAERIAMEMQRMLPDANRTVGVRLLLETGLAAEVLPESVPRDDAQRAELDRTIARLVRLPGNVGFPLALAAVLPSRVDAEAAQALCRRWRLSNKETDRVGWLVQNRTAIEAAAAMPWSQLHPVLAAEEIGDLLTLIEAGTPGSAAVAHCRRHLEQPRDQLDPPPLLTGNDLLASGIPSGPQYKMVLERIRAAQLDGQVHTKAEALALAKKWVGE